MVELDRVTKSQRERVVTISSTAAKQDNHGYFQKCSIKTVGVPNIQIHAHPLGLTELKFDNCAVRVRKGADLTLLIKLGMAGRVQLRNVNSCGWIATDRTLLPAFVFIRWMSSMRAV